MNKLAGKHREYAESDKDFIPRNRHCLKEDKSHTNSDSSDRDGKQEVRHIAHGGRGGVKRQGTPVGNTDRQQRSCSTSAESDGNPANEKKRKSLHYHHHHRYRRRHHRHHRNRSSPHQKTGLRNRETAIAGAVKERTVNICNNTLSKYIIVKHSMKCKADLF